MFLSIIYIIDNFGMKMLYIFFSILIIYLSFFMIFVNLLIFFFLKTLSLNLGWRIYIIYIKGKEDNMRALDKILCTIIKKENKKLGESILLASRI